MKQALCILLAFICLDLPAQENLTEKAAPIVAEGRLLYRSEMASWHGTDLFIESYKNHQNIGGYFSYVENNLAKCIFFSKSEQPRVIGTMTFDSTYDLHTAKTDLAERDFTKGEHDLYMLRKKAYEAIDSDTIFTSYKNTNFNLIPLIHGNEKKVYVLTGPKQGGVVIFGNDYLILFDKANNLVSTKQLHKNILPVYYGKEEEKDHFGTMHTHLPETGDFITPTDICTLMLYGKFTKWKQHNVVSKNYLNIWNCETNRLVVVPMGDPSSTGNETNQGKMKKD